MALTDAERGSGVRGVAVGEIATGTKRGAVDTLKRLAEALGVRMDDVV